MGEQLSGAGAEGQCLRGMWTTLTSVGDAPRCQVTQNLRLFPINLCCLNQFKTGFPSITNTTPFLK